MVELEAPVIMLESPLAPEAEHTSRAVQVGGSEDWYGACSVETFNSQSPLVYTHDDAAGWLDYITQFRPANFWYGDANVKAWLYEEANDNWQDTYGADAVVAFYHSGHGITDSNGVFQASLGASWDGRDAAFSNRMMLGNEQAKYLFWSTCQSLKVLGTHNPIRTWHPANGGLRMIFGFETDSVDNPNYGKFFWEEWNKNKSFCQAWLDASWRIEQNQIASVCACGANQEDARNRILNERAFFTNDPGRAWYEWHWTNAGSTRSLKPTVGLFQLPTELMIAEFVPVDQYDQHDLAARLADGFNIGNKRTSSVDSLGNFVFRNGHSALTVSRKDGRFDAVLAKPNYENKSQINTSEAQRIVENLLQDQSLGKDMDIELYDVRYRYACGGTPKGSGTLEEAYVTETTFEFRQFINELPAINPDAGTLRVTVDNDGQVTNVRNSLRSVARLSGKPKSMLSAPPDPSNRAITNADNPPSMQDLEIAFEAQLDNLYNRRGEKVRSLTDSPSAQVLSTEIGYDVSKSHGSIVASRLYELNMGGDFKKLYRINIPVFE